MSSEVDVFAAAAVAFARTRDVAANVVILRVDLVISCVVHTLLHASMEYFFYSNVNFSDDCVIRIPDDEARLLPVGTEGED